MRKYVIRPEQYGFRRCKKSELTGGTPEENAGITRKILSGEEKGAKRDAVVLNSMFAYHIVHPEVDLHVSRKIVESAIDSGKATEKLESFIKATQEE